MGEFQQILNRNKRISDIKKSPIKRLKAPTPSFFKKLQVYFVIIGTLLGGASGYILQLNPSSKLGIFLGSIAGFLTFIAPLIANLTVNEEEIK